MLRSLLSRTTVFALIAGAAVLVGAAPTASACHGQVGPPHSGGLLPNGDFERAVTEPDPVGATIYDVNIQPGLPDGWVFEGSAGLFDYADVRADTLCLGNRHAVSGYRFLAISTPASSKARYCVGVGQVGVEECVDSPAEMVKDEANLVYTVDAHWRNALPVQVGTGPLALSFHTAQEAVTIDTFGAVVRVRWLDELGVPVRTDRVYSRFQDTDTAMDWTQVSVGLSRPAAATQAVVLLGNGPDIGIGQVRYDNVRLV